MPNRLESLVSHGKGAVKQFQARLEGRVGVFATLVKQHGELSALLERCRSHRDRRVDLWPEIRKQLLAHERGEARVLYPELRLHDATRVVADHHDTEVHELERLIERLDNEPISTDIWGDMFERLTETVLRHAHEEEKEIFPAAQEAIGAARARQLEPQFVTAFEQAAGAH